MLIKSLKMKNFRQFKGTTAVEFSCNPNQNVTIILGDNTYGTSSLIQSVCVVSAPEKMSQMLLRACWGFQLWIVPSNTSEPKATKKQS